LIWKRDDQIIPRIDLDLMQASDDFSSYIGINKSFGKLKMFSKDIQLSVTSDETNERDRSVRNIINIRQSGLWGRQGWSITGFLDELERGLALKAAIPMVFIMEELKVLGLGSEVTIAPKPLPPEESPIVSIIKALHDSITPRFSNGYEDHLDSKQQAESEDDAKRARVAIASTETKFVVDLKKVGDAHYLPTMDQAQSHGLIVLPSLRVKKDSVTVEIHDVEGIEAAIVFDISGSDEVRLMDVVESQGLPEIGIFHSLGSIRSFF
jgi:hypothetical protein